MNPNPLSDESRKKKLQSPNQIGSVLKVTALPTYILAFTALLLMGAFFVWGFLGSVSDKVYYSGVVFPQASVSAISPVVEKNGMVHLEAILAPHPHLMPGMTAIVSR